MPDQGGAEGRDTGNGSESGDGRSVADASDTGDEGEIDEEGEVEDSVEPTTAQARLFASASPSDPASRRSATSTSARSCR